MESCASVEGLASGFILCFHLDGRVEVGVKEIKVGKGHDLVE
jgi:hypothetical protein